MEESGRGQIKVEGICYLEPAPKGQMEGLSLYKWGNEVPEGLGLYGCVSPCGIFPPVTDVEGGGEGGSARPLGS